jgi:hypothetical protein
MIFDLSKTVGFWQKKSSLFEGCKDYLYINTSNNKAVSCYLIKQNPILYQDIFAEISVVNNNQIMVANKKTGDKRENYFKVDNKCLQWSIDNVRFGSWFKIRKSELKFIPDHVIDASLQIENF